MIDNMADVMLWLGVSNMYLQFSLVVVFILGLVPEALGTIGCSEVRNSYKVKGYNAWDVPYVAISGEHLKICPQGFTCCTKEMENNLAKQSLKDYDVIVTDSMENIQNTFRSRTLKFDRFFTELLDKAKRDLHDMFVRTYGLLYQRNAFVFSNLFNNLQRYYKGEDQNLADVLDQFFTVLMQKMFELLNQHYEFDQTYLNCVTEYMDKLKPFGDVPQVLSHQVKRAFIAARTFVQGLAIGRNVIEEMAKIPPSSSCKKALMKMIYCPHCRGLPRVMPCKNMCLNVMKGCLGYHYELNSEWNNYIDALMLLAERLEGPFNIELVVDPINVKISSAIMNFQENSQAVSSKVFAGCGQPRLSGRRKRRDATEEYSFGNWNYNDKNYARPTTAAGTSLDRLVRDIKGKVKLAKHFWTNISHAICKDEKVAASDDEVESCWNGLGKAKYMPEVSKDGLQAQVNNPEVEVEVMKKNAIVEQQILQLQLITNRLKDAYNGHKVDWIDIADVDGSGSGDQISGSGSGDGVNDGNDNDIGFTLPPPKPPGNKGVRTQTGASGGYHDDSTTTKSTLVSLLLPLIIVTWKKFHW